MAVSILLLISAPALVNAATISLAWNANPESDNAGYIVEYGTSSGIYSTSIDVGQTTSYALTSLSAGTRYYFAVRAYNTTGETGPLSEEVSDVAADPPSGSGLVAAYGFEEGAGTLAGDTSGNANHGTLAGAGWHTTGRFGNALTFDGVDDSVTIPDGASLDLAAGMTLEAWVYPTAAADGTVIAKESADGLVYALYSFDNAPVPIAYINTGAYWSAEGSAQLPSNAWSHLAATYDGTTLRLFINAALVNSRVVAGSSLMTSTGGLRLGGNNLWGEFFQGHIDEVRIYNRALSASDIATDMNTPVVPAPVDTGLVAAYGFEEGAGTVAGDTSGYANHGTISGTIWHSTGRFGKALRFDGIDDWVTIPDRVSLDLTAGMTLEAWVYPTTSADGTVIAKESVDGLVYALYSLDNAPAPVAYVNTGDYSSAQGPTQLPSSAWSHLAATYDGATLRLFINGALVNSRVVVGGSLLTSSGVLRLGGNSLWGEFFQGRIDEVRIYKRALSASEIADDMVKPIR